MRSFIFYCKPTGLIPPPRAARKGPRRGPGPRAPPFGPGREPPPGGGRMGPKGGQRSPDEQRRKQNKALKNEHHETQLRRRRAEFRKGEQNESELTTDDGRGGNSKRPEGQQTPRTDEHTERARRGPRRERSKARGAKPRKEHQNEWP